MNENVNNKNATPSSVDEGQEQPSIYTDQSRPLKRALTFGTIALVVVTLASLVGWWMAASTPGLYGALIGAGLGGGFILITVVLAVATAKSTPTVTAAVVLGGWLVKLVAMIVVLALIKDLDFYSKGALFLTVILALIIVLASETWGILSSRTTYVS
ncbi:MAG: hypothetical protein ACHEUT_06195 [Corynebacterium pyruviciproducens]|uniref:hypothetical protein n=1 Tax=Corynebacterium pyruviciproducens TaxID=598660 RepID=UPI003982FCC0